MCSVKLGFVGAGRHASANIYPAAIEVGAEIAAVSTRHMENSQAALLRFGSQGAAYDSYRDMIDREKLDGVIVVAGPNPQFEIAAYCAGHGVPVFADKPLGMTMEQAMAAAAAAEKTGVVTMVGFMKRHALCYSKLKAVIDGRELGQARSFQANFCVDATPFCDSEDSFVKLAAIHVIDLVRFLFGDAAEVMGYRNTQGSNINMCVTIRFESGVVGTLYFTSMTAWTRESENITVTFDNGFAKTDELGLFTVHHTVPNKPNGFAELAEEDTVWSGTINPNSGTLRDLYLRGFVGEIQHFIDCLKTGAQPTSNFADNVKTMQLCDDILRVLK